MFSLSPEILCVTKPLLFISQTNTQCSKACLYLNQTIKQTAVFKRNIFKMNYFLFPLTENWSVLGQDKHSKLANKVDILTHAGQSTSSALSSQ